MAGERIPTRGMSYIPFLIIVHVPTEDDEERPAPPVAASSSAGEDNGNGSGGPLHYPYEKIVPAPILHDDAGVNEDGLAVATAVTDADVYDEYIYSAIEYDPDSKPPLHRNRRFS